MQESVKGGKSVFFSSIRFNYVGLIGLAFTIILALGWFFYLLAYHNLVDAEKERVKNHLTTLGNMIDLGLVPDQENVRKITSGTEYRLTLLDSEGRVLADSGASPKLMESHSNRPEFLLALSGHPNPVVRYSDTLKTNMLYYAESHGPLVLRISLPLYYVNSLFNGFTLSFSVFFVVGLSGMALLSWLMYRSVMVPVRRLLFLAKEYQNGSIRSLPLLRKPWEFELIGKAMRNMALALREKIESEAEQRVELEELLETLRDPVIVVNKNEIIYKINAAALTFIRTLRQPDDPGPPPTQQDILAAPLLAFVRSSDLSSLIERAQAQGSAAEGSITLFGAETLRYSAFVSPLRKENREKLCLVLLRKMVPGLS